MVFDRRQLTFLLPDRKYSVGVVPSVLRNIEMNALGVLYPDSSAARVIFAPSASTRMTLETPGRRHFAVNWLAEGG